ncbi:MAG: HAD hydrolase-like protein [Clostridiales bacterium]|nr:HAD hydrolase-like protein [Clostridiales bacterium]
MKKYDYIFFDLDGTISDSAPGIVNSVIYSLNRMGTEIKDREQLKKFVGPPLAESFSKYYGYTPEEAGQAAKFFREYYQEKGIFENSMYKGVDLLLDKLLCAGRVPVLATSKPESFAKKILLRYGIDRYFHFIAGSTLDETRTKKEEVIAYALESCEIKDKSKVVMIGDRSHDVVGAKKNGLDCIGVLYGYGSREELEGEGALCIAETINDLERILI